MNALITEGIAKLYTRKFKFWTDRIEIRAFYLDKFNDKNDVTI